MNVLWRVLQLKLLLFLRAIKFLTLKMYSILTRSIYSLNLINKAVKDISCNKSCPS